MKLEKFPHYYGNFVRRLFLLGAIIMAITLPSLHSLVPGNTYLGLFIIIILGLVSGLISPMQRVVITINLLISLVAVFVFEYYAVSNYVPSSFGDLFFWVNQILAIVFLLALYYSSKTFRGLILDK